MSVLIRNVSKGSPAEKAGIKPLDLLISLNGNYIVDVLDYRFYQNESQIEILIKRENGAEQVISVKKGEYDELGLEFDTYLMDKQHPCKNKCIFCFIDQLPKGMRESLYFKDDDSRMSFLFGNYITLTNLTEHEIERIIKLHISPMNVSVHTTNPELRVKMMGNRFAGQSLDILKRLCDEGISVNCQLVLVPGWNDGEELKRSLDDLVNYPSIGSIACVPVGLTGHREGLTQIEAFNKNSAADVVRITEDYGKKTIELYGERRVFAADEFYLTACLPIPDYDFYGDFLQLENGVGMWSMFSMECDEALEEAEPPKNARNITIVTGEAAYELIRNTVDKTAKKWHNLNAGVYAVKNKFFAGGITVTGLLTGGDIIDFLKDKELGTELLISSSMLRHENDMFLDNVTVVELEKILGVKVRIVENDGWSFVSALAGEDQEG